MAYFDSPKNQAIWDKEIAQMEAERERRRQNGFKPVEKQDAPSETGHSVFFEGERPGVRRITLKELEMIVRVKKGLPAVPEKERQLSPRTPELTMEPVLQNDG